MARFLGSLAPAAFEKEHIDRLGRSLDELPISCREDLCVALGCAEHQNIGAISTPPEQPDDHKQAQTDSHPYEIAWGDQQRARREQDRGYDQSAWEPGCADVHGLDVLECILPALDQNAAARDL